MAGWRCTQCGFTLRKYVHVVIELPRGAYTMSKQRIALDDVTVHAADWEREFVFCPGCGWQQAERSKPSSSAPPPITDDRVPTKR